MNDEHWPKIMLNYNVAGTYHRGRPKIDGHNNINGDMKSLKINAELAFDWHKETKATRKKTYSPNASNPCNGEEETENVW